MDKADVINTAQAIAKSGTNPKKTLGEKIFYLALVVIVGTFLMFGGMLGGFFYYAKNAKDVELILKSPATMSILQICGTGFGTVLGALFVSGMLKK